MFMTTTWHVSEAAWQAYAAGTLDPAAEASVETHVIGCGRCQAAARGQVAPETTAAIWASVRATVERPGLAWPLRALRRLGVPEDDLVVVGASGALALVAAVAVGAALAAALVTGFAGIRSDLVFMALVPLVPVLAVVAEFDATDDLRELAVAAPFSKLRIALLRSGAALAIAVPVTAAIGYVVPHLDQLAFVWLLPSLGLTLGALVLQTWFDPWVSGGAVAAGWVTVAAVARSADALSSAGVQVGYAVVSVVLIGLLVLRTSSFRLLGGQG
jgi:hypothetical protein